MLALYLSRISTPTIDWVKRKTTALSQSLSAYFLLSAFCIPSHAITMHSSADTEILAFSYEIILLKVKGILQT
jgi:hypothetical protein